VKEKENGIEDVKTACNLHFFVPLLFLEGLSTSTSTHTHILYSSQCCCLLAGCCLMMMMMDKEGAQKEIKLSIPSVSHPAPPFLL
jgi:hypothetical protein